MKQKKDTTGATSVPDATDCAPEYPYGTRLEFDAEQIKKLGIGNLQIDDEVDICATGKVTAIIKAATSGGKPEHHVTVQVTKLGMCECDGTADDSTTGKKMFPSMSPKA